MKRPRQIPLPKIVDELDDDTDEIELSPAQARFLSLAADADDPESSTAEVSVITPTDRLSPERSPLIYSASGNGQGQMRVAGFLGTVTVAITVGGLWRCTADRNPPAPLVAENPFSSDVPPALVRPAAPAVLTAPTAPTPPALPASPAIRIRNAFDRSEVFEFPAGTSEADARASVAATLLQRARERR